MVASDEPALAVDLPNDVRAPAAAREVLRSALPTSARDGIGQIIELLTDELVSNVVRHVGAPMQLRAYRDPSSVRIEVDDPSTDPPRLQRPDPGDDHGRGILLVETLATVWGVDLREDGKTVWFEIETPPLDG
jgi:anti-sigma regulatory factor (Ser/Thr protein kinase)